MKTREWPSHVLSSCIDPPYQALATIHTQQQAIYKAHILLNINFKLSDGD
jgi:hypothetical protein